MPSSGNAAFLDPEVNAMIKKVLNEWGKFLKVCNTLTNPLNTTADIRFSLDSHPNLLTFWDATSMAGLVKLVSMTSL